MKKSSNITATDGRVIRSIEPIIHSVVDTKMEKEVKKEIDKTKIHLGVLTKYYPYIDKAEVKVNNELIVCKILHRMHGSLVDFFTPEGDKDFCEKLKEPCIIPRGELDCLVADINDNTKEQLLLGYFLKNDVIYTTPANPGHYRIVDLSATNEYGLDIGVGDIQLNSNEGVTFTEGFVAKENKNIVYANSENVYTKNDVYKKSEVYKKSLVYTKEEVDELIKKAIDDFRKEIFPDDDVGDTNATD